MAAGFISGKWQNSTHHRIDTLQLIAQKFYVIILATCTTFVPNLVQIHSWVKQMDEIIKTKLTSVSLCCKSYNYKKQEAQLLLVMADRTGPVVKQSYLRELVSPPSWELDNSPDWLNCG